MKVIGLDLSTKCSGYSVFNNNKLIAHGVIDLSKNKDMEERSKQMMIAVGKLIDKENPSCVVCEETWNKNNIETTKWLSFIIGAAMGKCCENKIQFEKVLPSQWRAHVGIQQGRKKRQELKQEAIEMVRNKYSFDPIEDEAEAILIGLSKLYDNTSELFE